MTVPTEEGIHPSCLALLPPHLCARLSRLVSDLAEALGDRLYSVLVYGSAARFEHHPRRSDLNLMLVLASAGPQEMRLAAEVLARVPGSLRLRPLLLERQQIGSLPTLFPVETLDLRSYHLNLYGPDLAPGLEIAPNRLCAESGRQLALVLMRLRSSYLSHVADWRTLADELVASVPGVLALLHAALYSRGITPARNYLQLIGQAAAHFGFEREALTTPLRARRGEGRLLYGRRRVAAVFWDYTRALEMLSERLAQESAT